MNIKIIVIAITLLFTGDRLLRGSDDSARDPTAISPNESNQMLLAQTTTSDTNSTEKSKEGKSVGKSAVHEKESSRDGHKSTEEGTTTTTTTTRVREAKELNETRSQAPEAAERERRRQIQSATEHRAEKRATESKAIIIERTTHDVHAEARQPASTSSNATTTSSAPDPHDQGGRPKRKAAEADEASPDPYTEGGRPKAKESISADEAGAEPHKPGGRTKRKTTEADEASPDPHTEAGRPKAQPPP